LVSSSSRAARYPASSMRNCFKNNDDDNHKMK
jgi:hypothetical protein